MLRFCHWAGVALVAVAQSGCAVSEGSRYTNGYSGYGGYGGYERPGGYAATDSAPSASTKSVTERSTVVPGANGNSYVFRKPGETTIVRPNGGVTVIDRDPDGTRTIVNSGGGIQVIPPGGRRERRR